MEKDIPNVRTRRRAALDAEAVRQWVERTCAEQGVNVAVDDEQTIRRLVALLSDSPRPPISKSE
jgi:hypothetical protein